MSESNAELLSRVSTLLTALGPFEPNATRAEKWRTTDQLANELDLLEPGSIGRLDQVLQEHEAEGINRMMSDMKPGRLVRCAKYPDRTTALPLWGSTEHHEQPWIGLRPDRTDPAEDLPPELVVPTGVPHVFLSHTHDDAAFALQLAKELASMSVGSWRFETQIQPGGNIADCVRSALSETDAIVALVSRSSIASLWVLSELQTAIHAQKNLIFVVNADDPLLLELLETARFPRPDLDYDMEVEYSKHVVQLLKEDYGRRQAQSRTDRFENQVHDFMATLPLYLGRISSDKSRVWQPMLAFPKPPAHWSGFLKLASIHEVPWRLKKPASPAASLPGKKQD